MVITRCAGVVCLVLWACHATAQWKDWDYELEQEKKPWTELQAQLPKYPSPENLRRIEMGAVAANAFFVDGASVSVGDDGVVRYPMLIRTSGGAANVSFEGIRCDSRQARVYAFGHPGAQWSRARSADWRPIVALEMNGYQHALASQYFCTFGWNSTPYPLRQIQSALKTGPIRYDSPQ